MTQPFFDATQHKPATGTPEPLPVGTYPVAVTSAERKDNDKGWGLKVVLTVLDGEYQGRQVYEQYNLSHTNADTVRIAQEQFSALCHVTGVLKPRDPSELLNLPFQVKVKIQAAEKGYDARNRITQYLKIDGSKIGGGAAATTQPKAPKSGVPSWAAKAS